MKSRSKSSRTVNTTSTEERIRAVSSCTAPSNRYLKCSQGFLNCCTAFEAPGADQWEHLRCSLWLLPVLQLPFQPEHCLQKPNFIVTSATAQNRTYYRMYKKTIHVAGPSDVPWVCFINRIQTSANRRCSSLEVQYLIQDGGRATERRGRTKPN